MKHESIIVFDIFTIRYGGQLNDDIVERMKSKVER